VAAEQNGAAAIARQGRGHQAERSGQLL